MDGNTTDQKGQAMPRLDAARLPAAQRLQAAAAAAAAASRDDDERDDPTGAVCKGVGTLRCT